MAAGFNLPITMFTPQQLAEMARVAFRPPALMSGGGGGGGGGGLDGGRVAPAPAINAQDIAGLGQSLGGLGKSFMGGGGAPGAGAMPGEDRATAPAWPPPRADGGPVMPGQHYTVGERGPETFVPSVPGFIVPNDPYSAMRPSEMPLYDPSSVVRPSEMPLYDPSSVLRGSDRDFFGGRRRR